jgi:hypothetical protein
VEMGALNMAPTRRSFPGESVNERPNRSFRRRMQQLIGWPMPTAWDVVAVARKPVGSGSP